MNKHAKTLWAHRLLWGLLMVLVFSVTAVDARRGRRPSGRGRTPDEPPPPRRNVIRSETIKITSTVDKKIQRAIMVLPPEAKAPGGTKTPLLVAMHSWSGGYTEGSAAAKIAVERKWLFVAPHYRGSNHTPESCASPTAIQDVIDAINHVKTLAAVDENRIYLYGRGGGGHMALMLAAKHPKLFAAVSAWGPVGDLDAFFKSVGPKSHYAQMLMKVCGGAPGTETAAEYRARSPIHLLYLAKGVKFDLNVGLHAGKTPPKDAIPPAQTLKAYNALTAANGQMATKIPDAYIAQISGANTLPDALKQEHLRTQRLIVSPKPLAPKTERKQKHKILFRRQTGPIRLTILDKKDEEDLPTAFDWLAQQTQDGTKVVEPKAPKTPETQPATPPTKPQP